MRERERAQGNILSQTVGSTEQTRNVDDIVKVHVVGEIRHHGRVAVVGEIESTVGRVRDVERAIQRVRDSHVGVDVDRRLRVTRTLRSDLEPLGRPEQRSRALGISPRRGDVHWGREVVQDVG